MVPKYINSASANAATVTIPTGYVVGDLLLIYSTRTGSAVAPTVPAGWNTITSGVGTGCAHIIGYRFAQTLGETSGTWTNSTNLICSVYRDVSTAGATPFTSNVGSSNVATVTYPALTLGTPSGNSMVILCAMHRSTDTALETPIAGMTLRQDIVNTAEAVLFDSNGPYLGNFPSTNTSPGGTTAFWLTMTLELKGADMRLNNYQFVKVGDGMSTGDKIF